MKTLLLSFLLFCAGFLCPPAAQACREDTRICPDGTVVGRTGPDCEFACPERGGSPLPAAEPKECTAEARLCPDGTAVGRSGPNCEFTPCPGAPDNDGGSEDNESGIRGTATLGPNCPVMRDDAEWQEHCKDRPFQGTLIIREGSTLREATRVQTDPDGGFKVRLRPGHYTIVTGGDTSYPRCDTEVDVEPGKFKKVGVQCDTGMR